MAGALAALALTPAGAGAATSATQLPLPPLPPLPGPLPQIPLDMSDLALEYVTHFKNAGGADVAKSVTGVVGVTTPLDVDGNGSVDLTATLKPVSGTQFQLTIKRPGSDKLPVSVEAVINDPTQDDVLPRAKVAFGYDGRADTAPSTWITTVTAGSDSGTTSVDATTSMSGTGTSIRTLGGLFDGSGLNRTRVLGGGISYAPVPPTATLGMTFSSTTGELRAGASKPVAAAVDVEVGQDKSKRVTATIKNMPTSMRIQRDVANKIVHYWTSSPVAALGLKLVEAGGKTWSLDATQLPTEVGVIYTGSRIAAQTGSGSIGSATVGVSTGAPQTLALKHPYVNVVANSAVVRLDHIQQVAVDTGGGIAAEAMLDADAAQPFTVVTKSSANAVNGEVSNLPKHFRVAYTPTAGMAFYNGYDSAINSANLLLTSPTPFFGKVTYVRAYAQDLPTSVTVSFRKSSTTGTGAALTTTSQLGSIDAIFVGPTNDLADYFPPLATGHLGAYLRDVPNQAFRAYVHLRNVRGADVAQVNGDLKATLRTGPLADGSLQDVDLIGVLNRDGDAISQDATINGFVQDLPPTVTVDQTDSGFKITTDLAIPLVTVTARNLPGGSPHGEIHNLDATLRNLPQSFMVELGSLRRGISATSGSFGEIDFSAWDDSGPLPALDGFNNYVVYNRRNGALSLRGHVHDVKTAIVSTFWAPRLQLAFARPQSQLEFQLRDGTDENMVDSSAALLPPGGGDGQIPTQATVTLDAPEDGAHMIWSANARSQLYVTHTAASFTIDNLRIELPTTADLCVGTGRVACDPQSDPAIAGHDLPNDITLVSKAVGPLAVSGRMCLQKGTEDVSATCPDSDHQVLMDNLRFRNARVEAAKKGDYLKLYLDTDAVGLMADALRLKLDHNVRFIAPTPIRNWTEGEWFEGLAHISGVWDAEDVTHTSQMRCDGLHADIDGARDGREQVIPPNWCHS